ncbi:MAG: hypothetical protein WA194_06895 [Patescibacteria group bacterium]
MTRFQDYLKAEIFAETFSKIFFSGPAGRAVAVVFAITYGFFSITFGAAYLLFRIFSAVVKTVVSAYLNSSFHIRGKILRDLKSSVRKFGDRMEIRKGDGWTALEISGNGLRDGGFSIALAYHRKTDAVRIFRSMPGGQLELGTDEILRILQRENGFPHPEDFPTVYSNLRTHVL